MVPLNHYEVLSEEDILNLIDIKASRITEVIPGLDPIQARSLLSEKCWNVDETLVEWKFSGLGGSNGGNSKEDCEMSESLNIGDKCSICFEAWSDGRYTSIDLCEHRFCDSCWQLHLETVISEEKLKLTCPHRECTSLIPGVLLEKFLSINHKKIYEKHLKHHYVTTEKLRHCPKIGCEFLIANLEIGSKKRWICCNCSHVHCFTCGKDTLECECNLKICEQCNVSHSPLSCYMYKIWNQIVSQENYVSCVEQSRICKGCKSVIQRDGGCNHMTCKCRFQFCWLCGNEWKGYNERHVCFDNDVDRRKEFFKEIHHQQFLTNKEKSSLREIYKTYLKSIDQNTTEMRSRAHNVLCWSRKFMTNLYVLQYFVELIIGEKIIDNNIESPQWFMRYLGLEIDNLSKCIAQDQFSSHGVLVQSIMKLINQTEEIAIHYIYLYQLDTLLKERIVAGASTSSENPLSLSENQLGLSDDSLMQYAKMISDENPLSLSENPLGLSDDSLMQYAKMMSMETQKNSE